MNVVAYFPAVKTQEELSDLMYRSAWHFSFLEDFCFVIYTSKRNLRLEEITIPSGFSEEVGDHVETFMQKVKFVFCENEQKLEYVKNITAIIKWKEDDSSLNDFLSQNANCTIYRTDPQLVRQEGSFYIQCAFDTLSNKEVLINESKNKFDNLCTRLGKFDNSWVLATGPSVEEYKQHDFSNALTIVCNSTVLDDEIMRKCKPKILVFADPIFHFGVSQYAGEFRKIVRHRLNTTDIYIIVPLKYYALLMSIFGEYSDRIIGVPFRMDIDFNTDISRDFQVKTTANILTLLLLPIASTFSNNVNIIGCDGRPFEDDDYFWGHGKTVQINDKMDNIQRVHPGFFKIDYNEYYYEHCHTLECLLVKGEENGISYIHQANSHIPVLRDRNEKYRHAYRFEEKHCLLIEPDGIGKRGHYVSWHNQIIEGLIKRNNIVTILCNKNQDPNLYFAKAVNVFTSHSWGISRSDWCFKKGFESHPSFICFFDELKNAVENYCHDSKIDTVSLFMYYSSIQILAGFHRLRTQMKKKGIDLKFSLCLFHESVILDDKIIEPRIAYGAKNILFEGLAQTDSYRIASVTEKLMTNLYNRLNVLTKVMPNPIPNEIAVRNNIKVKDNCDVDSGNKIYNVVFPCALRPEKGERLTVQFVEDVIGNRIELPGIKIFVRKIDRIDNSRSDNLEWINHDLSDAEYEQLLDSANLIVIPYLAPQFKYRTSGIIVDCLKAKKPIIVIADTWLADVVKTYRNGLAIKPYSSLSLSSAINTIKANSGVLSKYTSTCFYRYNIENSWNRLIEVMFDC